MRVFESSAGFPGRHPRVVKAFRSTSQRGSGVIGPLVRLQCPLLPRTGSRHVFVMGRP